VDQVHPVSGAQGQGPTCSGGGGWAWTPGSQGGGLGSHSSTLILDPRSLQGSRECGPIL
jgi:hypothetical protein